MRLLLFISSSRWMSDYWWLLFLECNVYWIQTTDSTAFIFFDRTVSQIYTDETYLIVFTFKKLRKIHEIWHNQLIYNNEQLHNFGKKLYFIIIT